MKSYIFYVRAMIVFNGGIALNLMVYAWLSPHWWMLNSRLYEYNPEIRVLGLTHMLEDEEPPGLLELIIGSNKLARYSLRKRRNNVCDVNQELSEAMSGIDKRDLDLLRNVTVPCAGTTKTFPMPIPPPQRLTHSLKDRPERVTNDDMVLRYGCELVVPKPNEVWCPIGYRRCPQKSLKTCSNNGTTWKEPACCIDGVIGETIFNQVSTPSYVQVYGWAQWQALMDPDNKKNDDTYWCSAREFRCQVLSRFVTGGRIAAACLVSAAILTIAMLGLGMSPMSNQCTLFMAIMYAVIGAIVLYGRWTYASHVEVTLKMSMTPLDKFGRAYIHPMMNYQDDQRSLLKTHANTTAEWQYGAVNAHVDFMTEYKRFPEGFTSLWGARFGLASAYFSFAASIFSLERYCSFKGFSPLYSLMKVVAVVVLAPFYLMKNFIDNVLAPYPVLWVYPWQKLYPKAFTCGSWLPWPFDAMYDLGLMLPVHVIRALWDYVSCQDICAPAEKKVLREAGIHNDRLQSLLCSRRSYFVMMAGLGLVNFVFNAESVITLADGITHYRQAASLEASFPWYRCSTQHGECPLGVPDVAALNSYAISMLIKVYAIVAEGCSYVEVTKALIGWLGGFIAVLFACFALAHWTDFATSRRFTLIGWLFMMLTPVITSSLCENRYVNKRAVEDTIVRAGLELWDEARFFLESKPCDEMQEYGDWALKTARQSCFAILATSVFMPASAVSACKEYRRQYGEMTSDTLKDTTELCKSAVRMFKEEGPQTHEEVAVMIKKHTPGVLDAIQGFVGLRAGLSNVREILPAVISMVPALMQGGLMVKNIVPRQSLPSILLTLPWAFTTLFWGHYQLFYQILTGKVFLFAALAMSFGPLIYYLYGKLYTVAQPMDDQQSITLTFRIWYYALILALVIPYATMFLYLGWLNDFKQEAIWQNTIGMYMRPTVKSIVCLVAGTLSSYAYTLQAGIDWFVDELVDHHICGTAPAVIASTRTQGEAEALQYQMDTTIDLDSIDSGTYVCGGLSDPHRLRHPPTEGDWSTKAQVYSVSLQHKDYATLDAFAAHIYRENRIPGVLGKGRHTFFGVMEKPPRRAFVWDEGSARELERKSLPPQQSEQLEMATRLPLPEAESQWDARTLQPPSPLPPPAPPYQHSAGAQPFLGDRHAASDHFGLGPPSGQHQPGGSSSLASGFNGPAGGVISGAVTRLPPPGWGQGGVAYDRSPGWSSGAQQPFSATYGQTSPRPPQSWGQQSAPFSGGAAQQRPLSGMDPGYSGMSPGYSGADPSYGHSHGGAAWGRQDQQPHSWPPRHQGY